MKNFARVLVALDLSEQDRQLLNMLQTIKPVLDIRKAYFLHVMPNFSVPKDVDVEFHKLFSTEYPVDEKIRDKLALDVAEALGNWPGLETSIDVREGKPYQKLLHWAEIKEVDLMMVGRKRESEGSGITGRRVARNSQGHVMFVPEKAPERIKNILVPIDFSENSARALQTALKFQEQLEDVSITGLYIIDLPPSDYYMRPSTHTGFLKVLQESAAKAYEQFVEQHDIDPENLKIEYLENTYSNISTHIKTYADDHEPDLIIMGAQGHSPWESFVFGSVTERLVERYMAAPILIVR
jgi:nucleotide-binding universal stress UspA family protein